MAFEAVSEGSPTSEVTTTTTNSTKATTSPIPAEPIGTTGRRGSSSGIKHERKRSISYMDEVIQHPPLEERPSKEKEKEKRNSIQEDEGKIVLDDDRVISDLELIEILEKRQSKNRSRSHSRSSQRRPSIQEDSSEEKTEKKRKGRRESIQEEPVFESLVEKKAALRISVEPNPQESNEEAKEAAQELEDIAREDFKLMIELYLRILFELKIQSSWLDLQAKGIVKQDWDKIEGKLYLDPKLDSIADNNNPEWNELKIRIFEIRQTLSDLFEVLLSSFSLSVYAEVFSLVDTLMKEEVQMRCKQSWYQRTYAAWQQEKVEVPIIFLLDVPELSSIAEVMFDAMDFQTRQKFVDIIFDNTNGIVRSVIERNLQRRRAKAVNKFMNEVGQMKHRALGFIMNTAHAMQRLLKKDDKEKDKDGSAATLNIPKRQYSRPASRDEIAKFMFGDEDTSEEPLGAMNHNPLFKKTLSHMRLGELLASSKGDLPQLALDTLQVPDSKSAEMKHSLTRELMEHPEKFDSINQFEAADQLLSELEESMGNFLADPEVQSPEYSTIKQRIQTNMERFQKLRVPIPKIEIEGVYSDEEVSMERKSEEALKSAVTTNYAATFSDTLKSHSTTTTSAANTLKSKKGNTQKRNSHWDTMKKRVRGLLSKNSVSADVAGEKSNK